MWFMIMIYELFCISFGQMFAAFTPNELLASLLASASWGFTLGFCGALVPTDAIPAFWRSWMVWVDPYHYLLEGMLAVAIHDLPVVCKPEEFSRFQPPSGQSCDDYAAPFVAAHGGYVQTSERGLCELCTYATGDQFAAGTSIFYNHRWRNAGIVLAFVAFNFGVVFLATWLKFDGARLLPRMPTMAWKSKLSSAWRKDKSNETGKSDSLPTPEFDGQHERDEDDSHSELYLDAQETRFATAHLHATC